MARSPKGSQAQMAGLLAGAQDLQKRILFVLVALIVYRVGTHIPLPGIDALALSEYQHSLQQGLFGMFNMFTGGAFSRMTIFALNVMPYITASIIIQLMSSVYPALGDMKKEGEAGRRRINQYTRYLTVVLALGQGFGLASGMEGATVNVANEVLNVVVEPGLMWRVQTALTLMTGTLFMMWLGEQITNRGIGQGISVIIFAGIVAELPKALYQTIELSRVGTLSGMALIGIALMVAVIMAFVVFMETAQRRVNVQYPKRQAMGTQGAESNHMPLKLNMAGVIPAIFASSLLLLPMSIAQFSPNAEWAQLLGSLFGPNQPLYMVSFVGLIIFFCFFYTAIVFNSEETADNLKKNGGFIPGIRPGKSTADYFDYVLARITVVGAVYMAFVCLLPQFVITKFNVPFYFGGTSLLIVVSVTIDLVSRIQTHLIAQKYEGLLKKSQFRSRQNKA